jgi:hypothetical protein
MNIPVLDEHGRTALVLHRTEDVTDYVRERAAREQDVARGEAWRRRVLEVEADCSPGPRAPGPQRRLREAHEREREVALTLQRAMLPAPTVQVPGLSVAACYRPAENTLFVGGNWFDRATRRRRGRPGGGRRGRQGPGRRGGHWASCAPRCRGDADHGRPARGAGRPRALRPHVHGARGTTVVQVRLDRSRGTVRYAARGTCRR